MMSSTQSLELAGVPVVVRPPANPSLPAPLIVLWHGAGIPGSEENLAETLPLEKVQAWKAYLGLPLFGKRLPVGGTDEIMQRQLEDYVLRALLPTIELAMQELPNVVRALQARFSINDQEGIGLFGFSVGGLTALLTLVESSLPIKVAVLAGVTKDLTVAVDNYERIVQGAYPTLKEQYPWVEERYCWTEESEVAKQRLDFVSRASEITQRQPMPAILFVHGSQDEIFVVNKVEELYATLAPHYERTNQVKRLSIQTFENLKHNIDLEAAENSPEMQNDIAELQRVVAEWFNQYLMP
ncbi:MAG: prolyl oligopeptidase family serine peptidase [Microcoleus sp. SIO2G3]|nr:prolyl oligopeptidase family serine peptidase [Microcoleus sp. SIO2G3]